MNSSSLRQESFFGAKHILFFYVGILLFSYLSVRKHESLFFWIERLVRFQDLVLPEGCDDGKSDRRPLTVISPSQAIYYNGYENSEK